MHRLGLAIITALAFNVLVICPASASGPPWNMTPPVRVIFDTDMYGDIDDALALAMLHAFEGRGEIELLAVTISTQAKWPARFVHVINTFYGRGGIPIGVVSGGVTPQILEASRFGRYLPSPDGINFTQYVARDEPDATAHEEAVTLLRRVLVDQPDQSVVLIGVGYMTNLARLLDSQPDSASSLEGRVLVGRKVKFLSAMVGDFSATGGQEFNLEMDVPAARKVFEQWPTPIVVSGSEVGARLLFPQSAIDRYFGYVDHHPIAETYNYAARFYRQFSQQPGKPHDHATYDLTSVLYAARPEGAYFTFSGAGRVEVLEGGRATFIPDPRGRHRILGLEDAQEARTLEAMILLASQPPKKQGAPADTGAPCRVADQRVLTTCSRPSTARSAAPASWQCGTC